MFVERRLQEAQPSITGLEHFHRRLFVANEQGEGKKSVAKFPHFSLVNWVIVDMVCGRQTWGRNSFFMLRFWRRASIIRLQIKS